MGNQWGLCSEALSKVNAKDFIMKITIIGCGNMGKAFAERLSPYHTLFFYDRHLEKSIKLQHAGYGTSYSTPQEAWKQSDIIILAVKPQSFEEAAKFFQCNLPIGSMLISLLTGTSIKKIRAHIPMQNILRMMPNLPLLCGEGIIGLTSDHVLSPLEEKQLTELCKPLGRSYWLEEEQMNAFTSLSGSGPAFVLAMMESMTLAGVALGFNEEDSRALVQQMVKGSVSLLEKSGKTVEVLKKQITSPGGTTQAGLNKFEELGLSKGIVATFLAAYERANEMSSY